VRVLLILTLVFPACDLLCGPALAEPMAPQLMRAEDRDRFRVTTFASGLGYPTSMATLADGSLLVATSEGGTSWLDNYIFASPRGALVRLVDADGDGVADGPPQTMAADLPGLVTSVRRVGDLVFALSSAGGREAVTVWRTGAAPTDAFTAAGKLSFSFPAGFEHSTYALAARPASGGGAELYFNVGAKLNSSATSPTETVGIAAGGGAAFAGGGSRSVAADAIHRVVVTDDGASLTVSSPVQIARGLRNAAGMVFDGAGNLWFEDNGIDTEGNRGVSFSADELNRVGAEQLGVTVPDFGFAGTYVRYADGATVGPTAGITLPLAAFTPIAGEKSEGAVEIAVAPEAFPADFAGGFFVPFSGVFNQGGTLGRLQPGWHGERREPAGVRQSHHRRAIPLHRQPDDGASQRRPRQRCRALPVGSQLHRPLRRPDRGGRCHAQRRRYRCRSRGGYLPGHAGAGACHAVPPRGRRRRAGGAALVARCWRRGAGRAGGLNLPPLNPGRQSNSVTTVRAIRRSACRRGGSASDGRHGR
jgi:hypothetical protein